MKLLFNICKKYLKNSFLSGFSNIIQFHFFEDTKNKLIHRVKWIQFRTWYNFE